MTTAPTPAQPPAGPDSPPPRHPPIDRPVALITGASSGIGRALAPRLARAGFAVALLARRHDELAHTADLCRRAAPDALTLTLPIDLESLGRPSSNLAPAAIARVLSAWGRLDALVNNAGLAPMLPIADTSPELIDRVFAVNALAPALLIAAAWPCLTARSGRVVNVSSLASVDPFPGFFAYAAAKSACNSMVRSLAREPAAPVRAFCVAPGAVDTPMLAAIMPDPSQRNFPQLAPDHVAALIEDCLLARRDHDAGRTLLIVAGNDPAAPPTITVRD